MAVRVQAVLLDLDGTLYHQLPLRAAMAAELGLLLLGGPRNALLTWQVLRAFRRVREDLRALDSPPTSLDDLQYVRTAELTATDPALVRRLVDDWIYTRPLRHLRRFRRHGVIDALDGLRGAGMLVGVFSDYPTTSKLEALGLSSLVSLQLCATDRGINAFKPRPEGFLAACRAWEVPPESVVYVGDRPEVDAAGAQAAGMQCLILRRRPAATDHWHALPAFGALAGTIERLAAGTAQRRVLQENG